MSRQPASTIGWLATMPTVWPSMRREADDDVARRSSAAARRNRPRRPPSAISSLHVVGLVGIGRDQRVERRARRGRPDRALGRTRRLLAVGGRQEVEEAPELQQRLDVVLEGEVGDARSRGVGDGAAQLLLRHRLVRHRLHHIGPGDEHVGAVLHHEDEVGHRRRIDRAAGAGPHDQRDLRHHARGQHVALEHLGIAGERGDAFLDARAAANR